MRPPRELRSVLLPLVLTGLALGGLLIGIEPVGGDPDRMYRPLKSELARALAEGRLPYWSEHLGLGFPLIAESHAAAFYPPNWALYRLLNVSTSYRLSMWAHYLLIVAATWAYARFLKLSHEAAALAAVAFALCGFQSIHSSHEWSYHTLAYLPLCLLLAQWHLESGRALALILLALAYALQLTIGHFQVQWWTAGLVVFTGAWKAAASPRTWRRAAGLVLALGGAGAIAAVQLAASWELTRFVGFDRRAFSDLAFFVYPPAHWAELVIPTLFRGIPGGPEAGYWYARGTSGFEACFYVGTIPLMLAFAGVPELRKRRLGHWIVITTGSLLLAMLPVLWPRGYALWTAIPGMGFFRAPGRYTALASLGLALAAGCGLDRIAAARRVWPGMTAAWAFAIAAAAWSLWWCTRPETVQVLGGLRLVLSLSLAATCWIAATGLILAWARGRTGAWTLLVATTLELGGLYYTSTTDWGWAVAVPDQSPLLSRLALEQPSGRVAGLLHDIPLRFGATPIFPYTGFAPPPPHPFLEPLNQLPQSETPMGRALLRRFGVTHGLWDGPIDTASATILLQAKDPVLDRLVHKPPGAPAHALWRLVKYDSTFPQARAATRARLVPNDASTLAALATSLDPAVVHYRATDWPTTDQQPRADSARLVSWDGRDAVVEHEGNCDLVIQRTYYPGWVASVDGAPARPVARAELGVQAVHLPGRGTSRVRFEYRPSYQPWAGRTSLVAIILACALAVPSARGLWRDLKADGQA